MSTQGNWATRSIEELLVRDLQKLASELSLYSEEASIWKVAPGITNSAGNLSLHLCGNLRHFIGSILGKNDYQRNREYEFAARGLSRAQLLGEIEDAIHSIRATLPKITAADLEASYPVDVFGKPMSTGHFLIHLSAHLGYHLGQVNYHRRLIG